MPEKLIISSSTWKGGVGKTTLVLALARLFSHNKKRVLIIATDPQKTVSLRYMEALRAQGKEVKRRPRASSITEAFMWDGEAGFLAMSQTAMLELLTDPASAKPNGRKAYDDADVIIIDSAPEGKGRRLCRGLHILLALNDEALHNIHVQIDVDSEIAKTEGHEYNAIIIPCGAQSLPDRFRFDARVTDALDKYPQTTLWDYYDKSEATKQYLDILRGAGKRAKLPPAVFDVELPHVYTTEEQEDLEDDAAEARERRRRKAERQNTMGVRVFSKVLDTFFGVK